MEKCDTDSFLLYSGRLPFSTPIVALPNGLSLATNGVPPNFVWWPVHIDRGPCDELSRLNKVVIVEVDPELTFDSTAVIRKELCGGSLPSQLILERAGITAIAMDMWDPYRKAVRAYLPEAYAKIVFGRFHVMRQVLEGVDQVDRREHHERQGDRRLTHTKFLWLKIPATLSAAMQRELRQMRRSTLKAARAWALKEAFQHIWEYRSIPAARAYFWRWEA
jgi:hypothetical protein